MSSKTNWGELGQDLLLKTERLKAGFAAVVLQQSQESLEQEIRDSQRDSDAAHAKLYGRGEQAQANGKSKMGDIYLGDVKITSESKSSNGLGALVKAAVGTGLLGTGAAVALGAAHLLRDKPEIVKPPIAVVQPYDDSDFEYRIELGREK
jgi:hypothetical protein